MKYSDGGRTYRLVIGRDFMEGACCTGCSFAGCVDCPENEDDLMLCCDVRDVKNHIWRETLFSKIRNWRTRHGK